MPTPTLTTIHLAHLPPDLSIHIALYTKVQNAPFLHTQLLARNPDFDYAFINASLILSPTHLLSAIFRACLALPTSPHSINTPTPHPPPSPQQQQKSSTIHASIVLALGTTPNIASTLRTFGISPSTTNVIAVKITRGAGDEGQHPPTEDGVSGGDSGSEGRRDMTREEISSFLAQNVQGEMLEFGRSGLEGVRDWEGVRRVYGGAIGGGAGGKREGNVGKKSERRMKRVRERESGGGVEEEKEKRIEEDGGEGGGGEMDSREMEMRILGVMALRGAG